jgi:hypothetical protein
MKDPAHARTVFDRKAAEARLRTIALANPSAVHLAGYTASADRPDSQAVVGMEPGELPLAGTVCAGKRVDGGGVDGTEGGATAGHSSSDRAAADSASILGRGEVDRDAPPAEGLGRAPERDRSNAGPARDEGSIQWQYLACWCRSIYFNEGPGTGQFGSLCGRVRRELATSFQSLLTQYWQRCAAGNRAAASGLDEDEERAQVFDREFSQAFHALGRLASAPPAAFIDLWGEVVEHQSETGERP